MKIRWPPLLERVVLGRDFDRLLNECTWPSGLKKLTVPLRSIACGGGKGVDAFSGVPEACEIKFLVDDGGVLGEEGCVGGMEAVGRKSSCKLARILESAAAAANANANANSYNDVAVSNEGVCVSVVGSGEGYEDGFDDQDSLGYWDGKDAEWVAGDGGGGVGSFGGVVDVFGYEPDAWEVEGMCDLRGQFVL